MPAYCACGDKVDETYDYGCSAGFTHGTTHIAAEQGCGIRNDVGGRFFELRKQSGTCDAVGVAKSGGGQWPCGHSRRKGNQQEYTAGQCRIENVAAKASECHFCYGYGKYGSCRGYPPWK